MWWWFEIRLFGIYTMMIGPLTIDVVRILWGLRALQKILIWRSSPQWSHVDIETIFHFILYGTTVIYLRVYWPVVTYVVALWSGTCDWNKPPRRHICSILGCEKLVVPIIGPFDAFHWMRPLNSSMQCLYQGSNIKWSLFLLSSSVTIQLTCLEKSEVLCNDSSFRLETDVYCKHLV